MLNSRIESMMETIPCTGLALSITYIMYIHTVSGMEIEVEDLKEKVDRVLTKVVRALGTARGIAMVSVIEAEDEAERRHWERATEDFDKLLNEVIDLKIKLINTLEELEE